MAKLADRSQRFKTSDASEPKGGMTADAGLGRAGSRSCGRGPPRPRKRSRSRSPSRSRRIRASGRGRSGSGSSFAGGHDARHADQIREMRPAFTSPAVSSSVLRAIGRTPVVRLRKVVPAGAADVLVKLEFFNPTGSYKDRMALAMIEGAERRGVAQARHASRRIHGRQHGLLARPWSARSRATRPCFCRRTPSPKRS